VDVTGAAAGTLGFAAAGGSTCGGGGGGGGGGGAVATASNARVRSATTLTRLRFVSFAAESWFSALAVAVGWLAPRVTGVARGSATRVVPAWVRWT